MAPKIINTTPHSITLLNDQNEVIEVLKSTRTVRVEEMTKTVGSMEIEGKGIHVPLIKTTYGKVSGLPNEGVFCPSCGEISSGVFYDREWLTCDNCDSDMLQAVFYIVSQMVKNALPERKDLLVPAEIVRDNDGRIVGCKGFQI